VLFRSTIDKGSRGAKKLANREAAKWEAELRDGRYKPPTKITWGEFRDAYESHVLPAMAEKTRYPISATFNSFERHTGIVRLCDVNTAQVTLWQTRLREAQLAEATIRSYSTHLLAALNWAHAHEMIPARVKVPMPKRARRSDSRTPMKGRPITTEEFERMLEKVPAVVGFDREASWTHLLWGLWLSGLRISEAYALTWDQGGGLSVDMDGEHPKLRIDADAEKGNRDRYLPIAPEFAQALTETPDAERVGYVFAPAHHWESHGRASLDAVKRTVGNIGEAAGVKVLDTTKQGKPYTKFASAHDFRQKCFRRRIPMENIVFSALFVIDHKLHGQPRAIWPFGIKIGRASCRERV